MDRINFLFKEKRLKLVFHFKIKCKLKFEGNSKKNEFSS